MKIRLYKIILLLFFSAAFVACGSGGGGSVERESRDSNKCMTGMSLEIEGPVYLTDYDTIIGGVCKHDVWTYRPAVRLSGQISPITKRIDTGITWTNTATGQSGNGRVNTFGVTVIGIPGVKTIWQIPEDIELQPGNNRVELEFGNGKKSTILILREQDTNAPRVTRMTPANGSPGFSIYGHVEIHFSEPMSFGKAGINAIRLIDQNGNPVSGYASYDSHDRAWKFRPEFPLVLGRQYRIEISDDVVDYWGGNPIEGDNVRIFSTPPHPDQTSPVVESVYPEIGSSCAPIGSNLFVNFNESIDPQSVVEESLKLKDSNGIEIAGSVSFTENTLQFAPEFELQPGHHLATLNPDVTDLAGNPLEPFEWSFDINNPDETGNWTPISSVNAPRNRTHHSMVWTGSKLLIWGGERVSRNGGTSEILRDGGIYDPQSDSWEVLDHDFEAPSVVLHSSVWTGTELIVFGRSRNEYFGRFELSTRHWIPMSKQNAPEERSGHIAIWTGEEMIIWGGSNENGLLNNGARYNPVTDSWDTISTDGAPKLSEGHVWTGSELIVWGHKDRSYDDPYISGKRYNPVTDTWQPIADGPDYSSDGSAVWTGTEMLVLSEASGPASYDPVSDTWTYLNSICGPKLSSPLRDLYGEDLDVHWTGSRLLYWPNNNYSSGFAYDPLTAEWTSLSTTHQPAARPDFDHLFGSVWTGDRFIIWGGYFPDDTNMEPTGVAFTFQ